MIGRWGDTAASGNRDDRAVPLSDEARQGGAYRTHRAEQLGVDDALPVVIGEVEEVAECGYVRAGHETVETAEALLDLREGRPHAVVIGDVDR